MMNKPMVATYHHQIGSPFSMKALPMKSGKMSVHIRAVGARNCHSAMQTITAMAAHQSAFTSLV